MQMSGTVEKSLLTDYYQEASLERHQFAVDIQL